MVKNSKNLLIKIIFFVSIIAKKYGILSNIQRLQGWWPRIYSIKNADINAIIVILLNYKFIEFEKFFILFLTIIFLFGTVLSLYHLGIEQGLIQESLVCDLKSGSNLLSKEEILEQLQEKSVSCKVVTFKMFGLSLTSYNILISILITFSAGKIYFNYDKN